MDSCSKDDKSETSQDLDAKEPSQDLFEAVAEFFVDHGVTVAELKQRYDLFNFDMTLNQIFFFKCSLLHVNKNCFDLQKMFYR